MNNIQTEKEYQAELLGILRDKKGFTIRNATDFDRRFAIDREMLFGFLNDTQPETIEKYKKSLIFEYVTGKKEVVRSKYTVDKKNRRIEIREIPYSTTSEAVIESVISLCKNKKIMEIDDIRDDTDKNGLLITIEYKRTADPDVIMNKLYSLTPLQDTFSCNFTMLVNNNPVVLGVYSILDEWIKFRSECIKRELSYDLEILRKKLHLLEGLKKILLDIDKAIKIIRGTKLDKDVIPNLMKGFDIDKTQAEYITEIRLRNINEEWILGRIKETEKIREDIKKNETVINSDKALKKQIIKKLKEIANNEEYTRPRKTTINTEVRAEKITLTEEVENYDVKIMISEHGYIKKIPANAYFQNDNLFEDRLAQRRFFFYKIFYYNYLYISNHKEY